MKIFYLEKADPWLNSFQFKTTINFDHTGTFQYHLKYLFSGLFFKSPLHLINTSKQVNTGPRVSVSHKWHWLGKFNKGSIRSAKQQAFFIFDNSGVQSLKSNLQLQFDNFLLFVVCDNALLSRSVSI